MTILGRQIWALTLPALAWTVHFIAIYALISAACAERGLIDMPLVFILGVVATMLCGIVAIWPAIRPPSGDALRLAVRLSAMIFALAILFDALPLIYSSSCGG
ncbi:MAG: hypothetical protein ACEPO2_12015 [Pelagibaca sp.]